MASERSSSVTMSNRRVSSQYRRFVTCWLVLAQHARLKCIRYACCVDAALRFMVAWGAEQRFKKEKKNFKFLPNNFAPQSKLRPWHAPSNTPLLLT